MQSTSKGKRLVLAAGVGLLALLIAGFILGAIGAAFFSSDEESTGFLSTPEVHLPAQPLLEKDAAEAEDGGLPTNRFVLTNTILSSWVATLLLIGLFFFATRGMKLAPRGLQNFMEAIIGVIYDFVESVAGSRNARRFFPVIATIFLFVVVNAWLGLLPIYPSLGITADGDFFSSEPLRRHLLRPAGTDLNMPLALALISFVFVEYWGIRTLGLGYFRKFFRFGSLLRARSFQGLFEGFIDVFVGLLELLSELVRVVSFTFRLFGNMTAGEILLLVTAFLVPFVFSLPFYGLEILVGFIQALIFAGLTLVFVTIAIVPHEGEEHG